MPSLLMVLRPVSAAPAALLPSSHGSSTLSSGLICKSKLTRRTVCGVGGCTAASSRAPGPGSAAQSATLSRSHAGTGRLWPASSSHAPSASSHAREPKRPGGLGGTCAMPCARNNALTSSSLVGRARATASRHSVSGCRPSANPHLSSASAGSSTSSSACQRVPVPSASAASAAQAPRLPLSHPTAEMAAVSPTTSGSTPRPALSRSSSKTLDVRAPPALHAPSALLSTGCISRTPRRRAGGCVKRCVGSRCGALCRRGAATSSTTRCVGAASSPSTAAAVAAAASASCGSGSPRRSQRLRSAGSAPPTPPPPTPAPPPALTSACWAP